MQKRPGRINWVFLGVAVLALTAGSLTVAGLWYWNKHWRAERGLQRGLAAFEQKQWDSAAVYLGHYLAAIQPRQDAAVLLKYAEAQMKRRPLSRSYVEQALRAYHQILRLEENKEVRRRLIEFYVRTDPAEAQRLAEAYLEKNEDAEIACLAALAMMQRGQYSAAGQRLQTVLSSHPDCLQAYFLLAEMAEQTPEQAGASSLEWLNRAAAANPSEPLAYLRRARYFLQTQQTDAAAADIRKAESLPLQTRPQKIEMASVYLEAGRLEDAKTLLEELLAEESNDLAVWLLQAQWAVRLGQPEEMVRVAQEGIASLEPDSYDFWTTASELLIQAGKWEQAEEIIRQMARKKEDPERISYLQGLLAEAKGDWKTAVSIWRKVSSASSDPDASLRLAQALVQIGDRLAAIQQLRTILLRFPEHTQSHALLARWCMNEGRWAEAAEHIQQVLRKYPNHPEYRKMQLMIRLRQMQAAGQSRPSEPIAQEIEALARQDSAFLSEQIGFWIETGQLEQAEASLRQLREQEGPTLRVRLLESDLLKARGQIEPARQTLIELCREFPGALEPIQKRVVLAIQERDYGEVAEFLNSLSPESFSEKQQTLLTVWRAEVFYLQGQTKAAAAILSALAEKLPSDISIRRRLLDWTRQTDDIPRLQRWIDEMKAIEGEQGRQWRYEQARLLFERGDVRRDSPQIISLLTEVLRNYPDDVDSRILLASVYEASGNLTLAIQEYQNALARDMDNLDLIVSAVSAMYRAQEYKAAEAVLRETARRGLRDPRLSKLEVQQLIHQGRFGTATDILHEMIEKTPDDLNLKFSLALLYLYQNQLEEAERIIRQLQEVEPFSLPVIAARVELALRKKASEEAVRICDEAIAARQEPRLYALRAMTWTRMGQTDKAEEDVRTLLTLTDSSRESFLIAADLFLDMNRVQPAIETMEAAVRRYPEDPAVLRRAVLVYARDSQRRKVLGPLLEKALAAVPRDPHLLLLKGQLLLAENTAASAEEGEAILNQLLTEYPRMETGWATLADWYLRNGQTGRAMDCLLRGFEFFPASKTLLLLKARLEGLRGGHLALPTLQDLYERFGEDDRVAALYAESLLRAEQFQEAESILRARLENSSKPVNPVFQKLYLTFLYRSGRQEEAGRLFEKEIRETPEPSGMLQEWAGLLLHDKKWAALKDLFQNQCGQNPQLLKTAARFCLQMGLDSDPQGRQTASECLRSLLERYPNHPQLVLSQAKLNHYWQQYKTAELLYRTLLAEEKELDDADRVAVMNNLAWILFHQSHQPQEALQWAGRGLVIQPSNADLLDTRGEMFFQMGDYQKAKEDFENAIRNFPPFSPERTQTGFRLVRTYFKLGEKEKASKLSADVVRWNQQNPVLTEAQIEELRKASNIL
jgi:tetratricopeptide (TPR) repeat protein